LTTVARKGNPSQSDCRGRFVGVLYRQVACRGRANRRVPSTP